MLAPAPHLPDALVFSLPVLAHVVEQPAEMLPQLVGNRPAVLVREVHRVHELAVDVELELFVRRVADPDRR